MGLCRGVARLRADDASARPRRGGGDRARPEIARGRLVVDSQAAALVESGDVVLGIRDGLFTDAHVAGELGAIAAGRLPGRTSDAEVTIFKSLGMAVEDVVAADLVYRRAVETGAGTTLEL